MSKQPLQYHYVVWAELIDGKIQWRFDVEGESLLFDGNVYDPSQEPGDGWRTLDEEEEGIDNDFVADLTRRLS